VVPPGTRLGPQLQLIDGGHPLGFLQAPTGLGDIAGPGSPRALVPHSRPLRLSPGREGGGLRGGSRGCFGDPAPQPRGAQGLPPTGELLHHPVIARGLRVPPAPPEPLAPPAGATASPRYICWHPRTLSTPSLGTRGWVAPPGALGTPSRSTALAPICKTGWRGGRSADGRAGFDGGVHAAVLFRSLARGISG